MRPELSIACAAECVELPVQPLPGEKTLQTEIDQWGRAADTLIFELTNGSLCYLPTSDAYARGGYETEFAPIVYGVYFLNEHAYPIVREAAGRLLDGLSRN